MANTTPMGRIAPASKPSTGNTPHFDPVALHGEAINACAMATYYTRKGNHAGAARSALRATVATHQRQPVHAENSATGGRLAGMVAGIGAA